MGDNIGVCPPLIISESEIDDLLARLGKAFNDTLAYVKQSKAAA